MSLRPPRDGELYSLLYSNCLDYGDIHPANWDYEWNVSIGAVKNPDDEWKLRKLAIREISKNKLIAPVRFFLPAKTGSRTVAHVLDRTSVFYFAGGGTHKEGHNTHAGLSGPEGSFRLSNAQEQAGQLRVGIYRDPIEWYVSWHWFQFNKFRNRRHKGHENPHFAKCWGDFKKWLFSHDPYPTDSGSAATHKDCWNDVVSPIRGNFYEDGNLGVDIVLFTERLSEGLEIFVREWYLLFDDPLFFEKAKSFKVNPPKIEDVESGLFTAKKNSSKRNWDSPWVWEDNEFSALIEIYAECNSLFCYDLDGRPVHPILINPGRCAKLSSIVVRNGKRWNEILKKHGVR